MYRSCLIVSRALLLLFFVSNFTGCTVRSGWPEHSVDVYLSSSGLDEVEGELWLVIDSVELVRCTDESASDRFTALTTLFSPSSALAHGPTTPTRQGTPHVVLLSQNEQAQTLLARFEPPPADYCKLVITIGPADDDAYNLSATNRFMESRSLGFRDRAQELTALSHLRSDHTFVLDAQTWQMGTQNDTHIDALLHVDLQPLASSLREESSSSTSDEELGRSLLLALHHAWSIDTDSTTSPP